MANIKIHELSSLNLSGAELFNDSESFMTELNDESGQMEAIYGGITARCADPTCKNTEVSVLGEDIIVYAF